MISQNLLRRAFTSLFLLALIFFIFNSNLFLVYSLIVLGAVSIVEFTNIVNKITKNRLKVIIFNIIFSIYIFFFCFIFFFFSSVLHLKVILFIFLLGCVSSDIGGYIFGNLFKGPKLTKYSPKKTISGAIGSVIFTGIMVSTLAFFFTKNFSYSILFISIITSTTCQIGDLFFSILKRKAKLKDTGNLLPGHGGVLDRIDGILFGIPFSFITLIFIY